METDREEPRVIYMDMPVSVKGFVIKTFDDGDDYYTVVLNPKYNWEQQRETYKHEIAHVRSGDLDADMSADAIEMLRHA